MTLRARRTAFLLLLSVLAALVVPALAAAGPSPQKLVAAIIAAGRSRDSVHYVSSVWVGNGRLTQVADIGRTQGIQRVTFTANGKTGHATVIVSRGALYVRGDAFTLENAQGFSALDAQADSGKWVRVMPSSPLYHDTVSDATLPSLLHDLGLRGNLASVPGTNVAGQQVVGVSGTAAEVPVPGTLYGRARGLALPVKETLRNKLLHGAIVLSRWNEPVRIDVPAVARSMSPIVTA